MDSDWTVPSEPTEGAHAPANDDATPPEPAPARFRPQRYRVEFEASEEYVALVERAKALLSHAAPGADLAELHLRAMRNLVAELEHDKYAVTAAQPSPDPLEDDVSGVEAAFTSS